MIRVILELYGSSSCPYTAELRDQLDYEGRPYMEYDVEIDTAALERLVILTGGRAIPALVENGRVIELGWRGRSCMV